MEEKLKKYLSRHTQTAVFLWMVVGGYLAYLAWELLTGEPGDANPAVIYIFAVIFAIVGIAMVAVSLYSMIKKYYKGSPNCEEPTEEAASEPTEEMTEEAAKDTEDK